MSEDDVHVVLDEYYQSLLADARSLIEGNGKRLIGINGVGSQLNLVKSGLITQFDDDKILSKYVVGENGSELSRSFKHMLMMELGGMTNMKWTSCMVGTPPQRKFTYHSQDLSEGEVQDAVEAYLAEEMQLAAKKPKEKPRFWDSVFRFSKSNVPLTNVPLRDVMEAAKKTSGIHEGLYLTSDSNGRTVLQGEAVIDGIARWMTTSEIVAVHTSSGSEEFDEDLGAFIGRHRNYMTKSGSVYHTGVFSWFELKKESIKPYCSLPMLSS